MTPIRDRTHWHGCWTAHHRCAVARIEELEVQRDALADALRHLRDFQNGPPLPSYEKDWTEAVAKADAILAEVEAKPTAPAEWRTVTPEEAMKLPVGTRVRVVNANFEGQVVGYDCAGDIDVRVGQAMRVAYPQSDTIAVRVPAPAGDGADGIPYEGDTMNFGHRDGADGGAGEVGNG